MKHLTINILCTCITVVKVLTIKYRIRKFQALVVSERTVVYYFLLHIMSIDVSFKTKRIILTLRPRE